MSEEGNTTEQEQADDWEQALAEQSAAADTDPQQPVTDQPEQAQLEDLHAEETGVDEGGNLDAILDIPVSLSVEIGQSRISIRNLLQLNQGSVVELDRLAGEPLDVMVNNTLVAHGEVVVINEKYGIRLTDVISAHDRVKQLH
ncbi:MAG: flagellar motor switch protein FliN [Gammaproteobacteria bacterium]